MMKIEFKDLYFIDEEGHYCPKNKVGAKTFRQYAPIEKAFVKHGQQKVDKLNLKGEFDVNHYLKINKLLFGDLVSWAGHYREWDVSKAEDILDGRTVRYSDAQYIQVNLEEGINLLKGINFNQDNKMILADDIANAWTYIWQAHAFPEGNTRTTAAFMKGYLEKQGLAIDFEYLNSDPHKFRDAMAMYTTCKKDYMKPLVQMIYNAMIPANERKHVALKDNGMAL